MKILEFVKGIVDCDILDHREKALMLDTCFEFCGALICDLISQGQREDIKPDTRLAFFDFTEFPMNVRDFYLKNISDLVEDDSALMSKIQSYPPRLHK